MKKTLITLCFAMIAGTASASTIYDSYVIESLPGCYSQMTESGPMHEDYTYRAITIDGTLNADSVSIRLNRDSSAMPVQNYICDSKEHAGDGQNTGDTYTATCSKNEIQIRRIFKQLKFPLIANYKQTEAGLDMQESFEGDSFKRRCSFIPTNKRFFLCDAEDRIGRKSSLKIFADSKIIESKDSNCTTAPWKRIYDDQTACGLKVSNSKCESRLVHNLGEANRPYDAAYGSVYCQSVGGKDLPAQNASFEINRSGNHAGSFVCGSLPKNELVLNNCKAITN